jgi:hypothetical protein
MQGWPGRGSIPRGWARVPKRPALSRIKDWGRLEYSVREHSDSVLQRVWIKGHRRLVSKAREDQN